MATIPLSFDGETPDLHIDDEVVPPDIIDIHGFVSFERITPKQVRMRHVPAVDRWKWEAPLYQVERPDMPGKAGFVLRRMEPGGRCSVSLRALRRIRGHGHAVGYAEAFGLLLGWPDRREIHAALPVGQTYAPGFRGDLFNGMKSAMPLAQALAKERGLAVVGLYCAARDANRKEIGRMVPRACAEGYLLLVPGHGTLWDQHILSRVAVPHDWLTCPWRLGRPPILEAKLNPRRIHSAWLKVVGPMDYYDAPLESPGRPTPLPPASATPPERDWFSAVHQPVDPLTLPPDWAWLTDAMAKARDVRIYYGGGSTPGGERSIRPLGLFTVAGYERTYLHAIDVSLDEERVFRLDRLAPCAGS